MVEMCLEDARTVCPLARFGAYRIYLVEDAGEAIYVGKSERNVVERFRQHLATGKRPPSSALGRHVLDNGFWADTWIVRFFTLEDCAEVVRWFAPAAALPAVDLAEQAMIRLYHPLLNVTHNPPSPLHVRLRAAHQAEREAGVLEFLAGLPADE